MGHVIMDIFIKVQILRSMKGKTKLKVNSSGALF